MKLIEREDRLASMIGRVSLTLRLSLLVREFTRLSGRTIEARVGPTLAWHDLQQLRDRKALLERMKRAVFELAPAPAPRRYAMRFRGAARQAA